MIPDPLTPERLEAIRARLHWREVGAPYYGRRRGPGGQAAGTVACGHTSSIGSPCCLDCYTALLAAAPTDLRDLLAEVERLRALVDGDAYRAGQEAMRERAAAEVCREAEDSCECDGPLNSGAVMGHGPLCPACSLNRLAEAIRALGVEP